MSIIHDALRKAKKNGLSLGNFEIGYERRRNKVNWGPIFIGSVLLLVSGPIVVPLLSEFIKQESLPQPVSAHNNPTRKSQFAIEEAVPAPVPLQGAMSNRPVTPALPEFSVSGIVFSSSDSYCILNGRILRVGESIKDAVLTDITPKQVTLDREGEKILLSVQD